MGKYKRIFVVVLDSLGIGAVEDSPEYGDVGVDTLGHIAREVPGLKIPNLKKLGMVNLHPLEGMEPAEHPLGRYMRLKERSRGKDTMTGHWEMMGLLVTTPFQCILPLIPCFRYAATRRPWDLTTCITTARLPGN